MKRIVFTAVALLALAASFPAGAQQKQYYKGNTHTHSLWSDGNDFPEMIVDFYHRNGYDFIALSDHDILAEGEKWMSLEAIRKRQRGLGRDAVSKYQARFGKEWIRRETRDGIPGIVLKTLEEFRGKFEEPGKFKILVAEEISGSAKSGPVHINAVNLEKKIPSIRNKELSAVEVMKRTLEAVAEQEKALGRPILAHLNHPNFQWAITAEDLAAVAEERFFEVYNGHPGINHLGSEERGAPGDQEIWDIANTIRIAEMQAEPLFGVATDDSHTYHGGDVSPGRGWVMVAAESLDGDAIVRAMRAGDFYASTGVSLTAIHYVPESRVIEIAIEPEEGATFTSQLIGTRKGYDAAAKDGETGIGEVLGVATGTAVRFEVPADALYARVTVTSSMGHGNPSYPGQKKQAWTQPVGWRN